MNVPCNQVLLRAISVQELLLVYAFSFAHLRPREIRYQSVIDETRVINRVACLHEYLSVGFSKYVKILLKIVPEILRSTRRNNGNCPKREATKDVTNLPRNLQFAIRAFVNICLAQVNVIRAEIKNEMSTKFLRQQIL